MDSFKAYQFKIVFLHFLSTFFQIVSPESTGFTLKLIPWDSPESPLYQPNLTQTQKIHMMVLSSKTRATLQAPKNQTFGASAIQIPTKYHDFRYSVNIKIGNPSKEVKLLLDTGSGPIWTRCAKSMWSYNPKSSKTYRALPCEHPMCKYSNQFCECIQGQCICTVTYGLQGQQIKVASLLSSDSFTLPLHNKTRAAFNIVFGCSTQSPIYSGILGMNKYAGSLISQVGSAAQGRYSYCLNDRGGYLSFGNDIPQLGSNAKSTVILFPELTTLYLDLTGISVARKRLALNSTPFAKGSFLFDTGAPYTVLKSGAYEKVIQEFTNYFNGKLQRVEGTRYGLDLCYKYKGSMKNYPGMTFHLRGADYETNNLYTTPKSGIMCIGLVPGEISILGVMQQWNTQFVYDIKANVMKFAATDCSKQK